MSASAPGCGFGLVQRTPRRVPAMLPSMRLQLRLRGYAICRCSRPPQSFRLPNAQSESLPCLATSSRTRNCPISFCRIKSRAMPNPIPVPGLVPVPESIPFPLSAARACARLSLASFKPAGPAQLISWPSASICMNDAPMSCSHRRASRLTIPECPKITSRFRPAVAREQRPRLRADPTPSSTIRWPPSTATLIP